MYTPLAEKLRPAKLSDVVGQYKLTAKDGLLSKLLKQKSIPSLIFWGPPGTGKTTLARIIADQTNSHFEEISAVTSNLKEVRATIERAKALRGLADRNDLVSKLDGKDNFILFIDEIHRFNKAQQDAFLPHIENGTIILIGATTENPSFEIINALLSRCQVVTLDPLGPDDIKKVIKKASKVLSVKIDTAATNFLVKSSNGDARKVINLIETAASFTHDKIVLSDVEQAVQKNALNYDKNGDFHYDIISAFIKSMRGSDENAALYYLFRMLEAGEDPKFIARRMVIFASEDVGMAAPYALTLATSCFEAVERIGLPECQYSLAHVTVALAKAKKSRATTNAMHKAQAAVRDNPSALPPLDVRNAPTSLMKDLGYAKDYKWQSNFKPIDGFLPKELKDQVFYTED